MRCLCFRPGRPHPTVLDVPFTQPCSIQRTITYLKLFCSLPKLFLKISQTNQNWTMGLMEESPCLDLEARHFLDLFLVEKKMNLKCKINQTDRSSGTSHNEILVGPKKNGVLPSAVT